MPSHSDRFLSHKKNPMVSSDHRDYRGEDKPTDDLVGVLDLAPEGTGVLRPEYKPSSADAYVSSSQIHRFHLRAGDFIQGVGRAPKESERYWGLLRIDRVNGREATDPLLEERPNFDQMTAVVPQEAFKLTTGREPLTTRVLDLIAPIGKGQRGLIVSPPKAGKTFLLKDIARGLVINYGQLPSSHQQSQQSQQSQKTANSDKPDNSDSADESRPGRRLTSLTSADEAELSGRPNPLHLIVLLVGERPEEVTDFKQFIADLVSSKSQGLAEVVASNFDEDALAQTTASEMVLERAKRLAELGVDVVILMDSITRLARAYNLTIPSSGRTLTGGFDPEALYPPKQFFGAARAFAHSDKAGTTPKNNGGSLTIIGTCLIDTGSRMDELIYEEFKGTGNMELHLSRKLQERRIFPAIDVARSGTRHEERLYQELLYDKIVLLRRMLDMLKEEERTEILLERLKKFETNEEFLESLGKG